MPFLLFMLSLATLVAVSSNSKAGTGGGAQKQTFTLDANMPEALRNQVLAALVSGTDPNALDAFATAIQAQYPLSAGLLHAKATTLRAGSTLSLPAPSIDPGGPPLDAGMPAPMVALVHTELLNEPDPNRLMALSATLAAQYPIASALLTQRAAILNVQPSNPAPPLPKPSPAPSSGETPAPANPSAPVLTIPGLDPGIPADVARAVITELATDNDPQRLQAYAQEIQSRYPMAASLLMGEASSLMTLAQGVPVPAAPSPSPAPTVPTPPPSPSPPDPPVVLPAAPAAPVAPSGSMLGMDPSMPPQTAQLVVSELENEQDPSKLQALAAQLAPQYPIAAALLNTRANVLLASRQPPAVFPTPPAPNAPAALSTYTVQKDDYPWKIAAHITGHGARWPELVAANPQKAKAKDGNFSALLPGEKLNLPPSWGRATDASSAASTGNGAVDTSATGDIAHAPSPLGAPAVPQAPLPAAALDAGIPPAVSSAVLAAVKTGTDPAQLRGFSAALASEGYPVAAGLLLAKANTLSPPPTDALPGALHADAAAPTYKVKAGDSPSKIANAIVHNGGRWPELVAANPQKKRAKDGNFASLVPGETLTLPPSWSAPTSHVAQGGR